MRLLGNRANANESKPEAGDGTINRESRAKRLFSLSIDQTRSWDNGYYTIVYEKIISLPEPGIVPWRKPWASMVTTNE